MQVSQSLLETVAGIESLSADQLAYMQKAHDIKDPHSISFPSAGVAELSWNYRDGSKGFRLVNVDLSIVVLADKIQAAKNANIIGCLISRYL